MREVTREEYAWAALVAREHYESCCARPDCSLCHAWTANQLKEARRRRGLLGGTVLVMAFWAGIFALIARTIGAH